MELSLKRLLLEADGDNASEEDSGPSGSLLSQAQDDPEELIQRAIDNTPPEHLTLTIGNRNPGPKTRGSYFDKTYDRFQDAIDATSWTLDMTGIGDVDGQEAVGFQGNVPGFLGLVAINQEGVQELKSVGITNAKLPAGIGDAIIKMELGHQGSEGTHNVNPIIPRDQAPGGQGTPVDFSTLIIGDGEDVGLPGEPVIWTIFPGPAITPQSRHDPVTKMDGKIMTVKELQDALENPPGLAKLGPPEMTITPREIYRHIIRNALYGD